MAKLSGPLLDRFQILQFTTCEQAWWRKSAIDPEAVSSDEIGDRVGRAILFRRESRDQEEPNALAPEVAFQVETSLSGLQRLMFKEAVEFASGRRHESVLRIARTCADLRQSVSISNEDLHQALLLGSTGHSLL